MTRANQPTDCPTPWCGHLEAPYVWQGPDDLYAIICGECQVEGPHCSTEGDALDAWNTRTNSEPRPAGDLREAVARKLCEQHGGDPDAIASEPHDCWEGALWTVFTADADVILSLATHSPAPMAVEGQEAISDAVHAELWNADDEVKRLREALTKITKVRVNGWDNIWAGANRCREIADAALAAHPSTQEG